MISLQRLKITWFTVFILSLTVYICGFLFVYFFNINNLILQSEDLVTVSAVPFSILKEGNVNLNEYYDLITTAFPNPDTKGALPYYLVSIGSNYYSSFPLLTSLLVLPLYLIPVFLNLPVDINLLSVMSRLGGAFITSGSVAIFYLILKNIDKSLNNKKALLLVFIYAFCTNNFSLNSQGLWQHGTSNLLIGIGTLLFIKKKYGFSGMAFGLSYISRPTNLLSLVAFGIYTLVYTRNFKKLVEYISYAIVPIILDAFFVINTYGGFSNTGYGSQGGNWTLNFPEGFLGIWLSPSKGILIVSPIFLFIFYSVYKYLREFFITKNISIYLVFAGIVFLHTFIMGLWMHWYGGYSWGYRMSSDVIVFMALLLIPFIQSKYFKFKFYRYLFLIFIFLSLFYQLVGLVVFDGVWHLIFDKGKDDTSWLWSIKNSQFVFSIQRILYKLGIISTNPIVIK